MSSFGDITPGGPLVTSRPLATLRRYLHVPLFNTERAWAYAMELKQDLERKVEPRKRGHLIRRLAKACAFAAELLRLVQQCCDSRSALEAEAYLAMMQGTWLMQKETSWEKALAKFTRARWVSPTGSSSAAGGMAD